HGLFPGWPVLRLRGQRRYGGAAGTRHGRGADLATAPGGPGARLRARRTIPGRERRTRAARLVLSQRGGTPTASGRGVAGPVAGRGGDGGAGPGRPCDRDGHGGGESPVGLGGRRRGAVRGR